MSSGNDTLDIVAEAVRNGDFGEKLVTTGLAAMGYSNRRIGVLERRNKHYLWLKHRYGGFIREHMDFSDGERVEHPTVWSCWLQGMDNAPELVKRCDASIAQYEPDFPHVHVDAHNVADYVSLPSVVWDKWKVGAITNTHFSDILRNQLLIEHGGIWLDATVLLTGPIPSFYLERPLFCFTHTNYDDVCMAYNSWFIASWRGNGTLRTLQDALLAYWDDNDRQIDYFLWHLLMTLVCEQDKAIAARIPIVSDDVAEQLSMSIFNPFDQTYWDFLRQMTPIHKLSNKYGSGDTAKNGTFYEYVMRSLGDFDAK